MRERTNPRVRLATLVAGVVMVAACSAPGAADPTVAPPTTPVTTAALTTTAAPTTTVAPTTAPPLDDFPTVACGELTGNLVCESYELIQRHYVDPVHDSALVEAALDGIAGMIVDPGDGIEVCPLPSEEFAQVCRVIDEDGLDQELAEEAAVAGIAAYALDPNSAYFDAATLRVIEEEQSGQVEGIGALVATEQEGSDDPNACQVIEETCRLRIVSTIEGGPARAAGLEPDDEFLLVDGESIEGWTVDEVTAAVRGEAGTSVRLTFLRGDSEFEVTIVRAAIEVPVVVAEMVDDVAYLRLNMFTENADEQVRDTLTELLANDPTALVLDLRNNPGGLLDTAVRVTSEFIPDGLVVSTQSPETTTPYRVEPGGLAIDPSLPMFVVVNEGSASASEVVAGALADAERATIVGENTFGKNTVQQRFPLSNGGALKLTIARWFTPDGHDFGGDGITPDVSVELSEDLEIPELVAAVTSPATAETSNQASG